MGAYREPREAGKSSTFPPPGKPKSHSHACCGPAMQVVVEAAEEVLAGIPRTSQEVSDCRNDLIAKAVELNAAFMQEVAEESRSLSGVPVEGVWCVDSSQSVDANPPMPSSDLQKLQGWLSARNCELCNVLEFEDTTTIAIMGALVGQGTAVIVSLAVAGSLDGASRSTLMSAVIDQAETKGRFLVVGSMHISLRCPEDGMERSLLFGVGIDHARVR